MDSSHATTLAAIITVGGLWSGKLLYGYIQEQHIKAAFSEAITHMQQTMQRTKQDARRT